MILRKNHRVNSIIRYTINHTIIDRAIHIILRMCEKEATTINPIIRKIIEITFGE
jgi:hypothetical protein